MTCPVFTTDLKPLIVEGRRITQENHGDALFPGEHDEIVGRLCWFGKDQVADVKFLNDFYRLKSLLRRMIPAKKMDDDLVTWLFNAIYCIYI